MITSYVTPDRSTLYLSLVGTLDSFSARNLVLEYHDRRVRGLRRCILDLSACEMEDDTGIDVLERLSAEVAPHGVELSLLETPHAKLKGAAEHAAVGRIDSSSLPFLDTLR